MIVAMHNGVIDENGINKGGIDSEKGWKCYVKQLRNSVGGSSIDCYSLGTEILGIDREDYEKLCAKEFALKASFKKIIVWGKGEVGRILPIVFLS